MTTPDIKERIAAFVEHIDKLVEDDRVKNGFVENYVFTANYLSAKWCRIERRGNQTSVFCFVALQDYETKALGVVKAGDIHKSATWKAPAKHARGNVFSPDFGNCITPYGVVYLK